MSLIRKMWFHLLLHLKRHTDTVTVTVCCLTNVITHYVIFAWADHNISINKEILFFIFLFLLSSLSFGIILYDVPSVLFSFVWFASRKQKMKKKIFHIHISRKNKIQNTVDLYLIFLAKTRNYSIAQI